MLGDRPIISEVVKIKSFFSLIFDAMQLVARGYYLRHGNLGWEWLPTDALLDQWINDGEIG